MAEEEKEEKKSNKFLPIIIGAVGGIVLLLAGLALGFFLFSSPAADPSAEVDEIIEKNTETLDECMNIVSKYEYETFFVNDSLRKITTIEKDAHDCNNFICISKTNYDYYIKFINNYS